MQIDLATFKKRSEFIEAYEAVEKERDYWREFAHDLEIRLQEYEGVKPTQEEAEKEFQKFWGLYGRKGNVKKTRKRWFNLPKTKKQLAFDKVSAYVKSTPEKCYRMGGDSWIFNEGWNDEIVDAPNPYGRPEVVRAIAMSKEEESKKYAEADKLRAANQGRSVKDILR